MQKIQRFVADQRFDLPHYESLVGYLSSEFNAYNKSFFSPQSRVAKNWVLQNNGGLQVKVNQGSDSTLFSTDRTGKENFIVRKSTDAPLTLNLADNATNYVEVLMSTALCAPDTVAIWDATANGAQGEEFTQTVDTGSQELPSLVSNTIAFTGNIDRLPLAIVVTASGNIVSITDARKTLFHLDTDWSFGVTRTDKTISNMKDSFDALATSLKEIKGTTNWYDTPWTGTRFLKEYQNMFYSGGGDIGFEGANGADNLAWTSAIQIEIADRSFIYTVSPATISILDGQALYVDIPVSAAGGPLTPVVVALSAVPIDPASVGYSPRIQVLFFRRGNTIYGNIDIPELDSGETARIGQDLPKNIRTRLGVTSESSFQAYTSTGYIVTSDNYPTALSKLDAAIVAFANDTAKEEYFTVGVGGQSLFTMAAITFSTLHTVPDIQVYVNGQKAKQSPDGTLTNGDFRKVGNNQIQFDYTVPQNAVVTLRDERAGVGTSPGGGVDLTNITVDVQPSTNGSNAIGAVTKGWKELYLKDTASAQVYRLSITSGVLSLTPVP